jgi:hypothetical protein
MVRQTQLYMIALIFCIHIITCFDLSGHHQESYVRQRAAATLPSVYILAYVFARSLRGIISYTVTC